MCILCISYVFFLLMFLSVFYLVTDHGGDFVSFFSERLFEEKFQFFVRQLNQNFVSEAVKADRFRYFCFQF